MNVVSLILIQIPVIMLKQNNCYNAKTKFCYNAKTKQLKK